MYDELGGKIYDLRYHDEQLSKYDEILQRLRLSPYEIVLDSGCGTGLLIEKIDGVYVGFDLASNLISSAYQKAQPLADKHLFQGDAENLPLRDDVFEVLLSFTLIQNLSEPARALSELRRVSRRKGSIGVTALRKTISLGTFNSILVDSGFKSPTILDTNPHDWIAIIKT
jgi:demethylmenaquinone methyltransferase/2-methoxy-6-polyprenyl-1,4-benzoquinol methylase